MSFLNQLKKQAEELQSQQDDGQRNIARNLRLVEAAAAIGRQYLMELGTNLEVLKPAPRVRYSFDRHVVLDGLPREDFRFDARRKVLRDIDVIDFAFIACVVRGPRDVTVSKDFVNEIEAMERKLECAQILHQKQQVRDPGTGKLREVRYTFDADVQVSTRMVCEHDRGTIVFVNRNLDGLETVEVEFAAHEITQARMDELARWWVGEPHRFFDHALAVKRVEAR